jgi:hypothetical protein
MKHYVCIFLTIVISSFLLSNTYLQLHQIIDCKCKNIELKGRVKVVTFGADLRIKVVESQPDLRVKKVARSAIECGEWHFVDSGEDFTIQFVNEFPDFTIKYVEVSPGMN